MAINKVLKPKSEEEISSIISQYTKYRIFKGINESFLQYLKTYKKWYSKKKFTKWVNVTKLIYISSNNSMLESEIKSYHWKEEELEIFVKQNPNIELFFEENKKEALAKQKRTTPYRYLTSHIPKI